MDNKRLIIRKIVTIVISTFLTLVLLPVEVRANVEDDETDNTVISETEETTEVFDFIPVLLNNQEEDQPGDQGPIDGETIYNKLVSQVSNETMGGKAHPYGYGSGETSLLKASTGVQLITQVKLNSSKVSSLKTFKQLNISKFITNPSACFDISDDVYAEGDGNGLTNQIGDAGQLAYMQAVSFDPTGCGRNNYVAYIGVDNNNSSDGGYMNKMWVYNAETKKVSRTYDIPSTTWEKDALNDAEYYARNFFSITAGDYDADGKDTLVVFTAQNQDSTNILEFKVVVNNENEDTANPNSNIDNSIGFEYESNPQIILNPSYFDTASSSSNTDPTQRLYCDLTTGDINADGIDDLVAVSGSDSTKNTYLGVLLGNENGLIGDGSRYLGTYVKPGDVDIVSAGVDVGNIDGETYNEIVVAGYEVSNNVKYLRGIITSYIINNSNTGLVEITHKEESLPQYANVNSVFPADKVWGRREVTCVAFDGQGNPEAVAVDNNIYKYVVGQFTQIKRVDPDNVGGSTNYPCICTNGIAASYVYNPSDLDDVKGQIAFEQLTYTQIYNNTTSHGGPRAASVIVLGNAHYNNEGTLTPASSYEHASTTYLHDTGKHNMTNILFNPVEVNENDVVKVRLNAEVGKQVLKGTPEPIAILQAAPWFSELGSSFVGSTTFGITETVGNSTSSGGSDFIGGGVAQSSQFPIGKQSLTVTFKNTINYSCTKQTVNKYSSSFSAGPKDTVVIRLSPADVYIYDTKWNSNVWNNKSVGMTVMRPPVYAQVTVDEYNALVDYMNANITPVNIDNGAGGKYNITAPKLSRINKANLHLGNEGNPEGYANIDGVLPDGWETISKGVYVLGYQGGSTTSNYTQEMTENDSFSETSSQDFRFELQFGGASKATGYGFWLGGFMTAGTSSTTGSVKITGHGLQTSGTVKNLDSSKDDSYENYGFEWSFGRDMVTLKDNASYSTNKDVPMFGYALSNVKKGVKAPEIIGIIKNESGDSCRVRWKGPELTSTQSVDSFVLYGYDIDGNVRIIAENIYGYYFDYNPNGEEFVSFAVAAKVKEGADVFESLVSKHKSVFFLKNGGQGLPGKSAYEIAREYGFSGTEKEWLATLKGEKGDQGLAGTNGKDGTDGIDGINGMSAYDVAVSNGFTGTEEEWLESLKGEQGIAGADGQDGKSAYEIAREYGFSGTEKEWLATLKGEKGDQGLAGTNGKDGADGRDGIDGMSAYDVAVSNGFTGTEEEWLESLKGEQGIAGADGRDGKSAYEIAKEYGFSGTEEEWLRTLKGEKGEKGDQGEQGLTGESAYELAKRFGFTGTEEEWLAFLKGNNGKDGDSAFEIAKNHGYSGTEEEWLESLKGEKGDQGIAGADGKNGKDGSDGKNGANGSAGLNGQNGLAGKDGSDGMSAYEIAVVHGFSGSEEEWLESLKGKDGENYSENAISGMSRAYVNEDNALVIVLEDGRDVTIGEVESKDNEPNGMHLRLKRVNSESGIKGIVKTWLPMLLALLSLIWNAIDLILILKLEKKSR